MYALHGFPDKVEAQQHMGEWQIVLSRDGTVIGMTGDAPPAWVGARLEALEDAPEDLRAAARAVVGRATHALSPVAARVSLESVPHLVHLIVVDALPLRRAPTDLRTLLRSSLEVMQLQAKAFDISLAVIIDDHVPPAVSVDADKVAWAATALVGNALRYVHHGSQTMPGGSITVRCTYNSTGPDVTIEVQDDGPGIPIDKLRLLFGVGSAQPRPGFGLAMVREVVAAHGGTMEVHSDPKAFRAGTTVRLTLPVA